MKYSTKETIRKAKQVAVLEFNTMRTPAVLKGWTTYRLQTINTENGHRYRITIFSPTPRVTPKTLLMVDSPNPLFVFYYEYAVAKRGNAFIYRSNGEPPANTNPRMRPGLDHHTIAALRYLVKRTKKAETATVKKKK